MADCVSLIQKNLESLLISEQQSSERIVTFNEEQLNELVEKIRNIYNSFNITPLERETINAHLLNEETGIISILKTCLTSKNFKKAKTECFLLLNDIIDSSGQGIHDYGSNFQNVCLRYLSRDVAADLKRASLITLSKVLEACQGYKGERKICIQTLIKALFFQLSLSGTKLAPTVKEEVLCLVGIVAHYYPEDFIPYQERVINMYLQDLKIEMKASDWLKNSPVIAGCLQGLKEYMFNFPVLCNEDPDNSYAIYNVARTIIMNLHKYQSSNKGSSAFKAALQILDCHSSQFATFVFEDCMNLYKILLKYINHNNRDFQKLGRNCLVSVLKVIAETVTSEFEKNKTYCLQIFKFFMEKFTDIFLESNNSKLLYVAVAGYGVFAGPCKLCRTEEDAKQMLQNIILKSEHEFFSGVASPDENILMLPCYVESLASIISNVDYVPETTLYAIEKIVIYQIDKFPKVPTAYSFTFPKSIIRLLVAVQPKKEIFLDFLAEIVYQGLLKTCSHPVVVEAESLKDKVSAKDEEASPSDQSAMEWNVKIVTYKDYIYLWKHLLDVIQLKELSSVGITLENRQYLMECIYDQVIKSSLELIGKLDLTLQQKKEDPGDDFVDEESDASSDPLHGIHAKNLTDYYIFLNIVDFLRDLLIDTCPQLFSKWVYIHGREMIANASRYSYHSGFYKLLSLNLSICNKIGYFKDILCDARNVSTSSDSNIVLVSFQLFSKFVKEIAVRLQQFKNELLASCLQVLLVLPIEIVVQDIDILLPALENALNLGLSYLPLATSAIDALEKWSESVPLEKMLPHFPDLLPCLNSYILASASSDPSCIPVLKDKKKSKKTYKMSTIMVQKQRLSPKNAVDDPELQKLQLRIIKFLGRLGKYNKNLLVKAYKNLDKVGIAWDPVFRNHLKYAVPFVDMKPEIFFDDFLPRILEIATKSSVRQIKVAACESLHSLVLFMIGRGSQMPEKIQEKYSMEGLYKNIFPGLLELACDVEQVSKQLFRPLVFQVIHWFTHSKVFNTLEASVILLALFDGVTDKENASLRDFSATCIKEYFVWFLRQASEKNKENNIGHLLNKIASLSVHPNPFKRIGAALTFNSIYRIFRNEEKLLKKYTMHLLVQFVNSLAIAHKDDDLIGTQRQCIAAIEHIEKIITVRHDLFLKPDKSAKVPVCLPDTSLRSVVWWLLIQCGCIQTECHRKCMSLVFKFCTLIPGIENPLSFLLQYSADGKNLFEDVFERELLNQLETLNLKDLKIMYFWLEAVLASLECYHWAFSDAILLQNAMKDVKYDQLVSSVKIFEVLEYFVSSIIKKPLSSVCQADSEKHLAIFSPDEECKFNRLKCTVMVRLLSFIEVVFRESAKWFHEQFFKLLWKPCLWEVLMLCILDPSSVGFDMNDPEVALNLPQEMTVLLKGCLCHRSDFRDFCSNYLVQDKYNLSSLLPLSPKDLKELTFMQLFAGYHQLVTYGLWPSQCSPEIKNETIRKLLQSILNLTAKDRLSQSMGSNPLFVSVSEKMLSLCYALGFSIDDLAAKLLPATYPDSSGENDVCLPFNLFISNICCYVSQDPNLFVQEVASHLSETSFYEISMLSKFIDHIAHSKHLRKNFGKNVNQSFLLYWDQLWTWSMARKNVDGLHSVLTIMTKMLLIDSEVALNDSNFYTQSLYPTFLKLLGKEGLGLDFIKQAFNILPFFLESNKLDLKACLEEIIAMHFPLSSSELLPGSTSYHTYVSTVKKMLSAMCLTGCDYLLEMLTVLICKEPNHIMEEDFKKSLITLTKTFRNKLQVQQQLVAVIFNLVLNENCGLSSSIQLAVLNNVLVVLLQTISVSPFVSFYVSNIKNIVNMMRRSMPSNAFEDVKLVRRIGGFKMMEVLYSKLSKNLLHSKDSQIVETFLGEAPTNGNELTKAVTSLCEEFKRTSFELERKYPDLWRKLNCACYNTLISVISCTQTNLKLYIGFLFKENPVKNERIWSRIIDCGSKLDFSLELDTPLEKQRQLVIMRQRMRSDGQQANASEEFQSSLQLLGTENMGLSSLAEDASKFEFTVEEQVFKGRQDSEIVTSTTEMPDLDTVELESDVLNQHECMIALSSLLSHMKFLGFIPSDRENDQSNALTPDWIRFLVQSFEDSAVHANVKLFLGRLITNNAKILEPYAKFLLKPMMSIVISGIAGDFLNYYILDMIITMLSWASSAVPEESMTYEASEVLKFVIKNSGHRRRDIFRNNMEVVKTILECWKNVIKVPYDDIYQQMNDPNKESKKNVYGIQLLGVVLSCNFPPFDMEEKSMGITYLNMLLKNLGHKYKDVHGSASEVIALVLKYLEANDISERNTYFSSVEKYLDRLKSQNNDSTFFYCLNKIHVGCPKIADKFLTKLLFSFNSVYGVYKNYILEVLCSRTENMPNAFKELNSIGLFEDLENKDEHVLFLSLQTLEKLVPSLNCDDILSILPDVVGIHTQPFPQCRLALFKILFILYEKYVDSSGAKEKEITRYSQESLIAGLADPDESVRLTVNNFWSNEKRLPSGTKNRLLALMKNLYSPATEESFLQYATFLLLERTSNSPDYKRKIFEHPLTECNFQAYEIQKSWRQRHVAMTPLFTETVSSTLNSSFMSVDEFSTSKLNVLRATQQNLDFPDTEDPSIGIKTGTYNWLTGQSMETYANQSFTNDSLFGSYSGSGSWPNTHLIANKSVGKSSRVPSNSSIGVKKKDNQSEGHSTLWMLKRRFVKDRNESEAFAKQELRRQDRRKELFLEQQKKRDAQVVMYRQYRIGDLPDIEITNSSIIVPIQVLAMNDAVIAKLLFQSLVVAISNYIEQESWEESSLLLTDIGLCFSNILNKSYLRTPSVISFCLETLKHLQNIRFDVEQLFVASIGSQQQSTAILLLESKLLHGFDYQPSSKKLKTAKQAVPEETSYWMKLAELYKSLNDYDVVNGIFSHLMGKRAENRKALQYEGIGDIVLAYELYDKLYKNTSEETNQAEKDFWDKSVLSCLDKLTTWEELEAAVTQRFMDPKNPDFHRIWEDQYIIDNYLPFWVRSKMKLLLDGKHQPVLSDFFDDAKKDSERKAYLENYSEDLGLLYILQDRCDIARQYSLNCFNKFLKDWQSLSPLAIGMQDSLLQTLLKYVELDEFLNLMKQDKFLDMSCTVNVLQKWQKRYPSVTDPVGAWDDMCTNRHFYLKMLEREIKTKHEGPLLSQPHSSQNSPYLFDGTKGEGSCDFEKLSRNTLVLVKMTYAETAAEQRNFQVAIKKLKEVYNVSRLLDKRIWSMFILSYCTVGNKRCFNFQKEKKLDILTTSWKQLADLEKKCGTSATLKNLQSNTLELIGEMFLRNEISTASLSEKRLEFFLELCGGTEQICPKLLHKSFMCLKDVLQMSDSSEQRPKDIASANMNLAHFCNKYLRKGTESDFDPKVIPDFSMFPVVLTQSLLNALEQEVSDAFLLFPRLLQIIELYPSCLEVFKEKVSRMPCWLFIGWINQIVVSLDKPIAVALHDIVMKIALTYPDAIIYAFNLSYEHFEFSDSQGDKVNESFVQKIKSILSDQTLISDFMSALEQLSVPAVTLREYCSDICQMVSQHKSEEEIVAVFKKMCQDLFQPRRDHSKRVPVGPIQCLFAEEFKNDVFKACGENGQKLCCPKSKEEALDCLKNIAGEAMGYAKKKEAKKTKLKEFSPWLNDFQSWKYSSQIEIPGQYCGRGKPLPDYHVKIAGFDEKVIVLSSLAVPRRITIRGNDEKEYKFLVKFGEDLRQDARIEQMFCIMNEIFKKDVSCARRHLMLKTYRVVPVTNRLGIIEWVDNTDVMKNFMQAGITDAERSVFDSKHKDNPGNKFYSWLKKFMLPGAKIHDYYWKLYETKDRNACFEKFEECINALPSNLLEKSFMKLSSSPEAFVALRTRFATSHAVICISQWILGIGDRHLGNFLIDKSSGYEIGIDFGHAFGSATQFLAVPELVPFRLTPQYLQLLGPLRFKGLYEETMVHVLSALRNSRELLINMMDIFIKEPTLDWMVHARKQQLECGLSSDDYDWFPKQRISIANKKLDGFNPCYVTREELKLGHGSRPYFKRLESVCLGLEADCVRSKYTESGLSAQEQVECLIDQATDPIILCFIYLGWEPWM